MCDQHCNVCDKGFTESCRLLTCPANTRAVELRPVSVSPVEALQRLVKDIDRKVFRNGCYPSMADWSAVAEMVRDLDASAAAPAMPAPAAHQVDGNVVAFTPRSR